MQFKQVDNPRGNEKKIAGQKWIFAPAPSLDYSSSFYGYIAEAWCLVNTTNEKMRILSLRSSQLYAAV